MSSWLAARRRNTIATAAIDPHARCRSRCAKHRSSADFTRPSSSAAASSPLSRAAPMVRVEGTGPSAADLARAPAEALVPGDYPGLVPAQAVAA